mmetsp:Transcript_44487/g.97159  ORF Transcript_44487/g.97159 Transcript_44487/m.97159 type:complete len:274 (+) Transcript_44487:710-1531(+)
MHGPGQEVRQPVLLQLPGLRRRRQVLHPGGAEGRAGARLLGVRHAHGGRHAAAPPRAGARGGQVPAEGGRARARHGLRYELHHPAGPLRGRRQGHPRPERRPEPQVHRGGRAALRRRGARLHAQLDDRPRGAAEARRGGGPARRRRAVAEDLRRRGGHLLHGGRLLPASGDRDAQEQVQGLPLPGRGALHRRRGPQRPRRDRALRRADVGGGRDDGDLHQVLRQRWRVRGSLQGGHRGTPRERTGQRLRFGHGAAVRGAGPAGPAGDLRRGRR